MSMCFSWSSPQGKHPCDNASPKKVKVKPHVAKRKCLLGYELYLKNKEPPGKCKLELQRDSHSTGEEVLSSKTLTIISVGKEADKLKLSCTAVENVRWGSHCGEQAGCPSNKKTQSYEWPSKSTFRYIPNEWKPISPKICPHTFTAALLVTARK